MSVICHDLERSYKGAYLLAAAVPFFVTSLFFMKSALSRHSQGSVPAEDIKLAVLFFSISALFTGFAIRILKYQYHVLFDTIKGQFFYKKDNLNKGYHYYIHNHGDQDIIEKRGCIFRKPVT